MAILTTTRLRLEPLGPQHAEGMHRISRLPEVMRHINGLPMSRADADAMVQRVQTRWATLGHSWWAFVHRGTGEVVGAGTVQHIAVDTANPLEIGWRLHPAHWHQGYATEAATAMRDWAFTRLHPPELMALCVPENTASSAVMQRLGMVRCGVQRWYDKDCEAYGLRAADWAQLVRSTSA